MNSCCSTFSPAVGVVRFGDFSRGHRCVVVAHCGFTVQFPNDLILSALHTLIKHPDPFSIEMSVQLLCPFVMRLFVFLLLNFRIFCVFGYKSFNSWVFCKYLLQFVACLSIL